jgi:hypothetical protein
MISENTELLNLLGSVDNVNSKRTYQTNYNKLMSSGEFFNTTITNTPNNKIIQIIKNITDNAFNRQNYLTIPIKLKKLASKPVMELETYREQNKSEVLNHKQEKKESANLLGITLKNFEAYVARLYTLGLYEEYIVNYLMLRYGVRTQDLDVVILDNKLKKQMKNDDNYLVLYKTKIEYIRNKYKTYKTYGQKKIIIKDKKFINAVKELKRGDFEPLLMKDGRRLNPETELNKIIQRMSFSNYGEGRLFKLLVDAYKYDENKLKELSDSRGTSLSEILSSYTTENLIK